MVENLHPYNTLCLSLQNSLPNLTLNTLKTDQGPCSIQVDLHLYPVSPICCLRLKFGGFVQLTTVLFNFILGSLNISHLFIDSVYYGHYILSVRHSTNIFTQFVFCLFTYGNFHNTGILESIIFMTFNISEGNKEKWYIHITQQLIVYNN